ncbi:unnamed protein product [Rhizoctonia solani]|uniref:Uncharacterized protein n=1 Tax=Rhizoctonia solani TaxID=456999 RepID=A0A8H3CKJ1_9AGAM|nr:unnamed protein product [Rhizoctonia solani]
MYNIRRNAPVVQVLAHIPPFAPIPPPNDLHPALVVGHNFVLLVRNHFAATIGHLFPETQVGHLNLNPDMPRRVRGVQRALFVGSAPLVIPPPAVQSMPSHCQRRLVLLISACCSSAAILWLSASIGCSGLSAVMVPVDLALPHVLDVVNESAGHVSRNVAAASSNFCLLRVGLKLAELACKASYGA